jgi:hypothetical protein
MRRICPSLSHSPLYPYLPLVLPMVHGVRITALAWKATGKRG